MVNPAYAIEGDCIVAVFACSYGCYGYMRWRYANRNGIVVAVFAGSENTAMIETCTYPGVSSMAVIANITAHDMLRVFAGCTAPVMTQVAFKRCALENSTNVATGAV
jgi:hypothetical protein